MTTDFMGEYVSRGAGPADSEETVDSRYEGCYVDIEKYTIRRRRADRLGQELVSTVETSL